MSDEAAVEILQKLPNLTQLDIDESIRVTDRLLHVIGEMRSLRILKLPDAHVSADAMQRLRDSLPDCKVNPAPSFVIHIKDVGPHENQRPDVVLEEQWW